MYIKYCVLVGLLFFYGCSGAGPEKSGPRASKPAYTLIRVLQAELHQQVKLPAQLAAYQEVSIVPKVNGYVKEVLVDIGSKVKKGQVLLTLEAPEIQQEVSQSKEQYQRALSDYSIDRENYFRLKVAAQTKGAISPMDLATAKAKVVSDSALSNSERANWQMHQTMLSYLRFNAPFDGVITERNTHPGALVSAEDKSSQPMLELKQINHLRLQVDIPEGFMSALAERQDLDFYLTALPGKKMSGRISRRSGSVNLQFRTERVEMDIPNLKGLLSPGMYADVILNAKGDSKGMMVPISAVVASTERKYVIVVRQEKATKIDVSTGIEDDNKIEVRGDLKPGEMVLSNANDEIQEGTKIN